MADRETPARGELSALLQDLAHIPEAPAGQWAPALAPGQHLGRFELGRELGRGSFGVVFEATDLTLGRKVAFKVLRPGRDDVGAEQLRREAEIAAKLSHPNLVTLYDTGRCEQGPYLVLELLEGQTLSQRLDQGPLPAPEALRVATEVARGLAHAHARGVAHRDLKPSNVFLSRDGAVKVLDFGLAHVFGRRRLEGGSPDYMAPEQWRGAPEDERTDVFALGVVLYRMLTGERPFPPDGEWASDTRPAPVLEVGEVPGLGELIGRMLALDPVERPRDGQRVLEALLALQAAPAPSGGGTGTTVRIRRRRKRRLGVVTALAAVAVLAAGAWFAWWQAQPSVPAAPSIAVLPFSDLSPARDQEFFSDGLTEEILDALAHVEGLKVTGRTSSFAFKGKAEDLRAVGKKLGVGAVLEGSVRREGSRVRVTAQLVQTGDGYHLWSQTYERELTGIFAVQDEIAGAVVAALKVKLLEGRAPTTADHKTSDPEAYRDYLLARQAMRADTMAGILEAIAAYQRALARDPGYAPAWAGLSLATYWAFGNQGDDAESMTAGQARARAAADKAVTLAPELADGYAARGFLRVAIDRDWAGAQADLQRALSLNPGAADIHWRYAREVLGPLGRFDEALSAARRATDLDPLSPSAWSTVSILLLSRGQVAGGRAAAERSLELHPVQDSSPTFVAAADLLEGKARHAIEAVQACPEPLFRSQYEAMALHDLGRRDEARALLGRLERERGQDAPFQIAVVHAWWGEADAAFDWLERAIAAKDGGLMDLRMEPLLVKLARDPRMAALEKRIGLPPRP